MKTQSTAVSRRLLSLTLAFVLAAVPSTSVFADLGPPTTVPGIAKPVVVVTGQVRGSESWTNNFVYLLRGAVFVEDGATLNIQAGTLVVGEAGSVGTLIVKRGGRLNAIGTREQPIVFTSDQPVGQRARGDWGGIILNGRAPLNIPGGEGVGEADTGVYGGDNPNDSSGSMRYVRVEFAGTEFSPDNELNGIAFQGVGRGGSYEFIQVHMNNCHNHADPVWQPPTTTSLAGGQLAPATPPNDGFFEVTSYIGGVAPAPAQDWTRGWTSYPQR